jgi:hypothetical protein
MRYRRVPSALSKHFTVMNESKLCKQASKKVMLLKPSQISELILDYDSEDYKTDTKTVVEEWGYEKVKNDPLLQHTSLV